MWLRSMLKHVAQVSSLVRANEASSAMTASRRGWRRRSRGQPASARLLLETLEARSLLSFNPTVNYPVGLSPRSVAAGLINADTALDLVTANYSDNTVSVLLNQGNGSFAAAAGYPVGASPYGVATGDFNRDGRADVVTANSASNNVSVLL